MATQSIRGYGYSKACAQAEIPGEMAIEVEGFDETNPPVIRLWVGVPRPEGAYTGDDLVENMIELTCPQAEALAQLLIKKAATTRAIRELTDKHDRGELDLESFMREIEKLNAEQEELLD